MPNERADRRTAEPYHGIVLPLAERFPLACGEVSKPRKGQEYRRRPEKKKKPCCPRGNHAPEKEQTETEGYDALDSVHDES